jgi:thiamine kinase-like enzyme
VELPEKIRVLGIYIIHNGKMMKMDNIDLIIETFEKQINKKACSIHQFENITNNRVFKIETESQPYIFKIYNSGWPENGKLMFVNRKLDEYNIHHAKTFTFNRDDDNFPNGYLIEECLPGITADRLTLSANDTLKLFEKLAALVLKIHQIKLTNYGYISSGIAEWTTFSEYVYDSFGDCTSILAEYNLVDAVKLKVIRQELYTRLAVCDRFPPVLCHGDLSTKNILVNYDKITLIDWDDAHSLCWMADVARLTLWMKLNYDNDTADACRKTFLNCYETEYDMNVFSGMEDTLHVWYGLDYLNFFAGKPQYENMKVILQESINKCRMQVTIC